MSYVHCHNCNWEQDDFWGWGYNPLKFFFGVEVPMCIRPRMMGIDPYAMSGGWWAQKFGLISIKEVPWVDPPGGPKCVDADGTDSAGKLVRVYQMHSWYMLWRQVVKWARRVVNQHWWTEEGWMKDRKRGHGACPKCFGPLCID